ncbi:MAG: LppP/LprE family lipoprotein, partial [Mycobacteriaceae bacterium]|nr:LppP/LprE family lipoprotein [Mycobacteriaceae bacterium]
MSGLRIVVVATVTAAVLAGCGAGDATVAKTPEPTTTAAPPPSAQAAPGPSAPAVASPAPPSSTPTGPTAVAYDPCAINLGAPEIIRAVASLPPDPRSGQSWSPEPVAGNYNECAQLSVAIVKANTNADNANTRALMFHQGKFIPAGVGDTFGFNGIDASACTGDTVALKFSNGVPGLDSVVRFRWNGNNVELVPNSA